MADEISEAQFDKVFQETRARVERRAMEGLQEIFHSITFGRQITFSDGVTATIKPFFEPQQRSDRDDHLKDVPHAGVDIKAEDGSWHLEFIIYQNGWGGIP